MSSWSDHIIDYYASLDPPRALPNGIEWLYPQQDPRVMELVAQFAHKYYDDGDTRTLFLGINPGRFGAGVTGVNFTAPRQLRQQCGIDHHLKEQSELSAEFIYDMIAAFGGPEAFYHRFFIGAVCPLGFVKGGKNINYYDDPALLQTVEPFIVQSINMLCAFGTARDRCLCIGGEKNFRHLERLNRLHGWFDTIVPLPHPRFIMQYRRRQKQEFIEQYLRAAER